jgi:heme oxygenase
VNTLPVKTGAKLRGIDLETTVRTRLRVATHPCHLQLNQHTLLAKLIQRDLTLSAYHRVLVAYFHLYQAVENRINQYLQLHPNLFDYSERNKLPWLSYDLSFFHDDLRELDYKKLQITTFPEIKDTGQLVGILYTLEGSTLGGQVISRNLAENHGLTATRGACFFNGYGERTLTMWQDFLSFAESISKNVNACQAAVESACQTFQLFEHALNGITHEFN